MKKVYILSLVSVFVFSCSDHQQEKPFISKEEMRKIVKELNDKFSAGVRTKDAGLLASIYSDSAQYVQPLRNIIIGKDSILNEWANFVAMKEHPVDLILTTHDISGDREIIYETGDGYTLLADSSKWKFSKVVKSILLLNFNELCLAFY